MIKIFSDIPEADILRLPVKNINQLGAYLSKFLTTMPNDELKYTIKIKGVRHLLFYQFRPSSVKEREREAEKIQDFIAYICHFLQHTSLLSLREIWFVRIMFCQLFLLKIKLHEVITNLHR